MNHSIRLNELKPGEFGRVTKVGGEGALRQHFLDMGVTPGTVLEMIKLAPMGDPMELRLHGYELTLRLADAEQIEIEAADAPVWKTACGVYKDIEHPGLGEYGKSHERKTEHPLPDSETLTFALAGNQNSGKTTLFNQLTGSSKDIPRPSSRICPVSTRSPRIPARRSSPGNSSWRRSPKASSTSWTLPASNAACI